MHRGLGFSVIVGLRNWGWRRPELRLKMASTVSLPALTVTETVTVDGDTECINKAHSATSCSITDPQL